MIGIAKPDDGHYKGQNM